MILAGVSRLRQSHLKLNLMTTLFTKTMKVPKNPTLVLLIASGIIATLVALKLTSESGDKYLSVAPTISQKFTAIPNEQALVDLSYHLQQVQGVTGVSYRDYSMATKSAVVTIYYDPLETSVRQLRIFLQHSRILWEQLART